MSREDNNWYLIAEEYGCDGCNWTVELHKGTQAECFEAYDNIDGLVYSNPEIVHGSEFESEEDEE